MSMTVKRKKDTKRPHVIQHRIADIRGGVSVSSQDCIAAGISYLQEGEILTEPKNGVCSPIEYFSGVAYTASNNNNLTVGGQGTTADTTDAVFRTRGNLVNNLIVDKKYYVVQNGRIDTVTYQTETSKHVKVFKVLNTEEMRGVEAVVSGQEEVVIIEELPWAIVGTGKPVIEGQNIDTDAWVFAVTKGLQELYPKLLIDVMKGIVNYE